MGCYDKLTGGLTQNCERPIISGLRKKGVIMNVDDIDEWITSGSANQFLPVLKAGKTAMPIEVLGTVPFTGTNVASAVNDFGRDFTKTVVFNIPESGSAASLKVEQLTKSESGFVIIVEGKDKGGDLNGTFIVFGKDEPLLCSVAKDYVAGVSAPVITATSTERGYENFLFHTDLLTTKTTFDTLYAADLTKRIYYLEHDISGVDTAVLITLVFGTAPSTTGYKLVTLSTDGTFEPVKNVQTPTVPMLSGKRQSTTTIDPHDEDGYFIASVMVELAAEAAGSPVYFKAVSQALLSSL